MVVEIELLSLLEVIELVSASEELATVIHQKLYCYSLQSRTRWCERYMIDEV